PVLLGPIDVPLDLTRATEVRVDPPAGLDSLTSTVIARQDGKEVGRLTRSLSVQGVPPPGEEDLFTDLEVAPLERDRVVRRLDAPVRDLAVGGGGRYFILHLTQLGKLAVFDVNEAKVVRLLPAPDSRLKLAAGLDKLVVVLPSTGSVQRWDLKTFELDLTAP